LAAALDESVVAGWMERLYVAAEGASLRREDRRKAVEVAAMLAEIARVYQRAKRREPFVLVDAAAGKGYVGLLAAVLVLKAEGAGPARVVTIEREPVRAGTAAALAGTLALGIEVSSRVGDVADAGLWPAHPQLVVALHACGPAADAVIDRTIAAGAQALLLCPCCTSAAVTAAGAGAELAAALGMPRQAPVRRRFLQSFVDAERTWRLEAAGYQTEVVELCPPTVTPHNLLWRARRVGEPGRMAEAQRNLERLLRWSWDPQRVPDPPR
jgi:threonine dehydrogenase-like Zn-dependent dehydrogenase